MPVGMLDAAPVKPGQVLARSGPSHPRTVLTGRCRSATILRVAVAGGPREQRHADNLGAVRAPG